MTDEKKEAADKASLASDEDRAWKWLNERDSGQMHGSSLELAALLADVRRETIEACCAKLESVERKLKLDDNGDTHIALYDDELKPLAKWLRAQMAALRTGEVDR